MLLLPVTFLLIALQLALPWRWAFIPVIIGALHLGNNEIFPEITPCRLIILVGIIRGIANGRWRFSWDVPLDRIIAIFSVVAMAVSLWPREDVPSAFTANAGLVLNVVGSYLYGRIFLSEEGSIVRAAQAMIVIAIPLAVTLGFENLTGRNFYAELGASREFAAVRNGRMRCQGAFRHSILAGTIGALVLPFAVAMYRTHRRTAIVGVVASLVIVFVSGSSGPLAAVGFAVVSLFLWRYRENLPKMRKWLVITLVVLHLISNRGVWFLMARVDLVGGSTGWHRAKLIDAAVSHFWEWWLVGTDFTRHWMPTGVTWSDRHSDMTNYYIHLGVVGGLGLVICLILMLVHSYKTLGTAMHGAREFEYGQSFREWDEQEERPENEFVLWCVGCGIGVHMISFFSVSYFGQMYVLFYILVGMMAGLYERANAPVYEEYGYDPEGYDYDQASQNGFQQLPNP